MIAANNLSGASGAVFSVVRYGNVIGFRGSVVPLFQRLVREGAKWLPITHPSMTRFWISLDQGVSFVLSCLTVMKGGEIFIPKIPCMRITDLARVIAPELTHKVVGIRPGEEIHEVMITEDDAPVTLDQETDTSSHPPIPGWHDAHLTARGAQAVPNGFRYSSDTNTEWLDT